MRLMTAVGLAAVLLVGCSDPVGSPEEEGVGGQTTEPQEAVSQSVQGLADCPREEGDRLTVGMVEEGCIDEQGGIVELGAQDCEDGRRLWSEGDLWGWVGEEVTQVEGQALEDDEYARAHDECLGPGQTQTEQTPLDSPDGG